MLNKILLAPVIFIFLISNAYASGFYAGIGGGRDTANFKKDLTIVDSSTSTLLYDKSDNQPGHGFLGNIFAGYGRSYHNFYLAAEANAALSSLKYSGIVINYDPKTDERITQANYTLDQNYGISLLPGYKINNWLLYGRVGYLRSRFKYSEYKTPPASDDTKGVTDRQWLNGIRYGLGLSADITKNVGLRLEYDHTDYQTYIDTSFPLAPGKLRTIKLTPSTDQVELDLVYKFA